MTPQELRKRIPRGYCKVIAERAGVSRKEVSDYFTGKIVSSHIQMIALKIAAKISRKKKNLLKQIE
ncbi:MAG TPA: hypothetical protein DGG95_00365 [Cytophagales bacterium]|jgi:hypothetical protein|nr:hypothetical protein [Cytophagales bacterium]